MLNIYKINNEKFKSIYFSVNFTMNANEKEISENAVLASLLSKSSKNYKTQTEIEKYMYKLYGAAFEVNVEKYGDLYNIEFLMELINKKYLPNNEDVIPQCINFLHDIITNPNTQNNRFDKELVEREKEFILEKIRAKKDDKLRYAVNKMEEIMCYPQSFGTFVYGTESIVKSIQPEDLYKRYLGILKNSCVTVVISGNLDGYENIEESFRQVFSDIESNLEYKDLAFNSCNPKSKEEINENIEESDTTQSVISLGLDIKNVTKDDFYILSLYNAILGSTPSSKLFQNFREKESLAYTVRSRYYRFKDIVIIYAGIERKNFEKAKQVIFKELDDIKNGNITDSEFNAAKESIISDLKEWDDSKIALSKMLLSNLFIYKNDEITVDKMVENISKITKEQVVNIAKKIKIREVFLLGGAVCE